MISIAFHLDEIPFVQEGESNTLKGYARKFIDQWCAMADMTPIWIDETKTLRKTNKTAFWSWQELLDEFAADHHFVFLDRDGSVYLDEFEHPIDNVIYCIGADYGKPFGDLDPLDCEKVRLRNARKCHGFTVVPMVTSSRMLTQAIGV